MKIDTSATVSTWFQKLVSKKKILPNIFKNSFMFILSVLPACVSVLNACLVPEEIRRQLVVSRLVGAGN